MKKLLKVLLAIVIVLGLFWGIVNIIPAYKPIEENPWRKGDLPFISAHRGGSELNPENTEMALDYVINETDYTDIVEIDLRLTKDGKLIINHDASLNRMALDEGDAEVLIIEHTYNELKQYNLGKNFVDRNGNKPYENYTITEAEEAGLTVMLLEDFLSKYQGVREFRAFIEVKDGKDVCRKIVNILETELAKPENSWWNTRVMTISFTTDVMNYTLEKNPTRYVAGMGYGMAPQLIGSILCLDSLFKSEYPCIQTSMISKAGPLKINCATKRFVNAAHKRNQAVVYWTINDEADMRKLIDLGADIITTDAPDVLANVLGKK